MTVNLAACSAADLVALTELVTDHEAATVACAAARADVRGHDLRNDDTASVARYHALIDTWTVATERRSRASAAVSHWTRLVHDRYRCPARAALTITARASRYAALSAWWDSMTQTRRERRPDVYEEIDRLWYAMDDAERDVVDPAGAEQRQRRRDYWAANLAPIAHGASIGYAALLARFHDAQARADALYDECVAAWEAFGAARGTIEAPWGAAVVRLVAEGAAAAAAAPSGDGLSDDERYMVAGLPLPGTPDPALPVPPAEVPDTTASVPDHRWALQRFDPLDE